MPPARVASVTIWWSMTYCRRRCSSSAGVRGSTFATALYIAGDPHIDSDAVFGVSGALVVAPKPVKDGPTQRGITYDFVLAGGARDGSSRVGSDPAAILAH